jgi:hypothetical protein
VNDIRIFFFSKRFHRIFNLHVSHFRLLFIFNFCVDIYHQRCRCLYILL